ncbi:family 20 glycosylhydrolase [Alkalimonas collagenimarina]|uniref:beta-N-acetylhexosaminidase n=1 Tax=Alkalimonas collagenimarina TaxID=400390 RepID=A0ABT9GWL1_9GAMM|nr:family 20 glycosylhydrolase [Alkalimonas collagenimarina]MDP4535254.1 family 20 glycosylhydrolase [Alkalimonas collagenimarina]
MFRSVVQSSFILLCLCCAPAALSTSSPDHRLMPYPQQLEFHQQAAFSVSDHIAIELPKEDALLSAAIKRFLQRLHRQTDIQLEQDQQATVKFELKLANAKTTYSPKLHDDESYQLTISEERIVLKAENYAGVFHGLETLLQLAEHDEGMISFPAVTINDFPRFPWRGLLLDPARHFLPVDTIKRQIDGMAAMKLNVLHWHLTDDQGWRIESKRFPQLHQVGGQDGYYRQQDIRDIVQYAKERGIRVVPEIDLPGHTTALGAAYPELMAMPGPDKPEIHWGVHPAALDPSNEQVYVFIEQLLEEVTELFPDRYIHIGGDEVLPDHWHANQSIQQFMRQHQLDDHVALHDYFNQRLLAIITGFDRMMIGWDEVLTPELPDSVLVQSWRGMDSMAQAAQQGHGAILSTGFYLDQPQAASYHYRVDPLPQASPPLPDDLLAWSSWTLAAERKRGSPIEAELFLLYLPDHTIKGYIDFAGRSRIPLNQLELEANRLRFHVDSWMGPIAAELLLGKELTGQLIVGNAPYAASGQQQFFYEQNKAVPKGVSRPELSNTQQQHILGGEIALWGEMVTQDLIDRRLWPQAAVVAERLWSAATMTDEDFMYQRLEHIEQWLAYSVDMQHFAQQQKGFASLVKEQGISALQQFVLALEPAHYYHRLHEKSVLDQYHNQAPLDRLVDFLPAEQHEFRRLEQLTQQWLNSPQQTDISPLKRQFATWQQAPEQLTPWLKQNAAAQELPPLISKVSELATIGLRLVDSSQPLTLQERQQLTATVQQTDGIHAELVIALQRLITQLLQGIPVSSVWVDGGFTSGIEGPAFGPDGFLYLVNYQQDGTIGRVSPDGAAELFITLPEGRIGNGIQFRKDGLMMIADYTGHAILSYDVTTKSLDVYAHNSAMHQPNDLTISRSGVIFASDPDWSHSNGQLWRIDHDGSTHLIESNIGTSNGIEIMPDQQRLLVNESVQRRIWQYPINSKYNLGERALIAAFSSEGLDGMRASTRGDIAVTRYGKGTVLLLDHYGQIQYEIPLQHQAPTNVAFQYKNQQPIALVITMQDCGCIERVELPNHQP